MNLLFPDYCNLHSSYKRTHLDHCCLVLYRTTVKIRSVYLALHFFQPYPVHFLIFPMFSVPLCRFWKDNTETVHHTRFSYCHRYHSIYHVDYSTLSLRGYQCQTIKKIFNVSISAAKIVYCIQ